MLETSTEDTTSLFTAISVYQKLLSFYGVSKETYDLHQKNYHIFKKILGSNLVGRKMDVKAVVVDRVHLQYELGILENSYSTILTQSSRLALKDLFKLAVSRYSEVRRKAQSTLSLLVRHNPFAVRQCLREDILATLSSQASHEEIKGWLNIYIISATQVKIPFNRMLIPSDTIFQQTAPITSHSRLDVGQKFVDFPRSNFPL